MTRSYTGPRGNVDSIVTGTVTLPLTKLFMAQSCGNRKPNKSPYCGNFIISYILIVG